ncbi:MAG TPA: Ig-like domain-containing protein, partial [Vicinamibacterales bacterium]|nr:Ig-like domain-containing protein [Vicinamibacterales bacterium]
MDGHVSTATCVAGAVGVFVSASPNGLAPGERSTLYATVSAADGGTLPSFSVEWSVADTSIATIGGPDENRRYFATARKAGTTEVTGRCGDFSAVATITIAGESAAPRDTAKAPPSDTTKAPPPDTTGAPAAVFVTLNASALQTGQSTQAGVSGVDANGLHISVAGAAWSSSNTGVATVTPSGFVAAVAPGSATISATFKGKVGSAALAVGGGTTSDPPKVDSPPIDGVTAAQPELPRSEVPDARFAGPTGRIIRVPAGGGVQEALNAARPGDAVVLTAGASHFGSFVLPDNGGGAGGTCTTWTTLTSDGALPSEGTRATPQIAASAFARLLTPSVEPALRTAPRASCWRVVGVEMATAPTFTGLHYGLVVLGTSEATSVDEQPHGVVLDRVYIHGQSTTNLMRCLALNSARSAVVNSWISDCHARGLDSQAIA